MKLTLLLGTRLLVPSAFWLLATLCSQACYSQSNWPRFRGPNGDGVSESTRIPAEWDERSYLWSTDLPGRGHSSPVVWGGRLFVTSADKEASERYLIALDAATGQESWRKTFPLPKQRTHKNNSFASSTPAVDQDRVFVLLQAPDESHLIALSHDGEERWRTQIGPYKHGQGPAVSLVVHKGLLLLSNDHKAGSFLGAFDAKSGKPVWRIERDGKRACYTTPCVLPGEAGDEVVFSHCFEGVIGVDLASGDVRWKVDPFGRAPQRAIGSPVVSQGVVIASSGARTGDKLVVALDVSGGSQTDARQAKELYRVTQGAAPHVPTPIIYQGRLFLWSDTGIVTCLEFKTGKRIWQKRIGGNFFASPICVGGRLVCLDVDGVAVVIEAGEKFKELGRTSLGEASHATPAVAGGVIFFRTSGRIMALKGEAVQPE
jgi:outer membrane protein assembly factor BamB